MDLTTSPPEVPAKYAELRLGVLAEAPSVRIVRKLVRAALEAWEVEYLIDNASVVASELATNGAKAAPDQWMEFSAQLLPEGLMLGCWDSSPELPTAPNMTDQDAEGGRGMHVIACYSAKSGVTSAADRQGKTVWALLVADESAGDRGC